MRVDVPAWPPVASRSTSSVRRPFGRAVHGRREARRAAAHDHEVVGVAPRLDLQADRLRPAP